MGDVPSSSTLAGEHASQYVTSSGFQGVVPSDGQPSFQQGPGAVNSSAFQQQFQQPYVAVPNAFSNQFDMPHAQAPGRQNSFNMTTMANALPQVMYRPAYASGQQQQRRTTDALAHGVVQPMAQYNMAAQPYYVPQPQQVPPYYNVHLPTSQQLPQQAGPRHNEFYHNPAMMNHPQGHISAGYYYPAAHLYPNANHSIGPMTPTQFLAPDGNAGDVDGQSPTPGFTPSGAVTGYTPPGSHAIWVGNLPPQTDLMSLVQHVCKENPGLESLFLISKSNCAFANFRDEQACVAAQQKLHDSKFQSVRLVSRLRKSTVEGAGGQTAPTGPSATSPTTRKPSVDGAASPQTAVPESSPTPPLATQSGPKIAPASDSSRQRDKFFILKSLTVEDLELSVRNGVWATQSHNETTLNEAFKSVDNVYLVFSANKSGEYFGYARMASPINDDPAAAIEFAPKAQANNDLDLPKAIPTDATENCPRGRIIDDSARGTIFWEIEREEVNGEAETSSDDSGSVKDELDGEAGAKAWGKPFKLEWLSTTRLPFYRTRGLRNPWNSNREVKIARDGTELEPSVGRKLIGLFNRVQSPPAPALPLVWAAIVYKPGNFMSYTGRLSHLYAGHG
ncbi:hypothetical protein DL762_003669 [Monosporascus cannonballus]|uniref:YTH domain-containing protein n=1 Tax=Monosporascus cannonballus TaxID=155416 RepID=A0ABY0H9T7_9PEZI|nr:hypothetical protein DL762_003669 [Monosporascus cannonballus]